MEERSSQGPREGRSGVIWIIWSKSGTNCWFCTFDIWIRVLCQYVRTFECVRYRTALRLTLFGIIDPVPERRPGETSWLSLISLHSSVQYRKIFVEIPVPFASFLLLVLCKTLSLRSAWEVCQHISFCSSSALMLSYITPVQHLAHQAKVESVPWQFLLNFCH